jgi:hypothetical protein
MPADVKVASAYLGSGDACLLHDLRDWLTRRIRMLNGAAPDPVHSLALVQSIAGQERFEARGQGSGRPLGCTFANVEHPGIWGHLTVTDQ